MFLHKQIHGPGSDLQAHKRRWQTGEPSLRTKFLHPMSEAAADAMGRTLVRVIPLVGGALLGGHVNHPLMGVLVGLVVATFLDLKLKERSLVRSWLQPLLKYCCPSRLVDGSKHHHKGPLSA